MTTTFRPRRSPGAERAAVCWAGPWAERCVQDAGVQGLNGTRGFLPRPHSQWVGYAGTIC